MPGTAESSDATPVPRPDWRAEATYTAAVQAFIYGFPYITYATLRYAWTNAERDTDVVPYAAVNHFWHAKRLLDASFRDGGSPSTDTVYSLAWLDLRDGPVILSHPDMGERYFTFQLAGFSSDNFAYVGQRTTGSGAGHFAIAGPGWDGDLPAGVRRVEPAPTPWVLVLGRTAVDGPADLPAARSLQEQYRLTPLGLWGKADASVPENRDVFTPPPPSDPLGPWKTLNAMLVENPPPAHHKVVLDQWRDFGIGPGLDVEAQPDVVKDALARAAATGSALVRQQFASGDWAELVNGWRYPPPEVGRFGDAFLKRAADQCLAGIAANDPAEAVYLLSFQDGDGGPYAPQGRYELHFGPGELPPVDAFWSLSAYTAQDLNLIPNPIDRYSISDHAGPLAPADDGGVTLFLQPEPPDDAVRGNWLPTSATQPWFLILRLYRPGTPVLDGTWRCPTVTRASDSS